MIPGLVVPSPQSMMALYWPRGAGPAGSVNVATVWGLEMMPATAVTVKLPAPISAGSATTAVLVAVVSGAASWLMVTVIAWLPGSEYWWLPLTVKMLPLDVMLPTDW